MGNIKHKAAFAQDAMKNSKQEAKKNKKRKVKKLTPVSRKGKSKFKY